MKSCHCDDNEPREYCDSEISQTQKDQYHMISQRF